MSLLDKFYLGAQIRATKVKENIKEFVESEKGVSNVVATIIILLIVVLIIGIFWGRLKTWIDGMMNTIFGTEITTDGMTQQ